MRVSGTRRRIHRKTDTKFYTCEAHNITGRNVDNRSQNGKNNYFQVRAHRILNFVSIVIFNFVPIVVFKLFGCFSFNRVLFCWFCRVAFWMALGALRPSLGIYTISIPYFWATLWTGWGHLGDMLGPLPVCPSPHIQFCAQRRNRIFRIQCIKDRSGRPHIYI